MSYMCTHLYFNTFTTFNTVVDFILESFTEIVCLLFALYQITVVYGGRHLVRVFPRALGYVVSSIWLHLISLGTVD